MPAYFPCPICHEDGQFGFSPTNGAIYFYHTRKNGEHCSHYKGKNGKVYKTELEMFNAVVVPGTPKTEENKVWIEARRADMTGNMRKSQRLYKKWKELTDTL